MEARRNQGKCSKERKSSRPSTKSQNPWRVTFPTSTGEVLVPRGSDLMLALPNELLYGTEMVGPKPIVLCDLYARLQPELCFAIGVLHMYVDPRLLPRKEVEPVPLGAEDSRAHGLKIVVGSRAV